MKTHAVVSRVTSGIKKFASFFWVVRITRNIRVIRPTLRWKHAQRRLRETAPDVLQKRSTVDSISDRLSNSHVPQGWIAQIKREIGEHRARRTLYLQIRLTFERHDGVGGQ